MWKDVSAYRNGKNVCMLVPSTSLLFLLYQYSAYEQCNQESVIFQGAERGVVSARGMVAQAHAVGRAAR